MTITYDLPEGVEASVNNALASLPKKKRSQRPTTEKPARTYMLSHHTYVVPAPLLRDFINKHHHDVIDTLAQDMASILRANHEAVIRRLHDVMRDKARICNVNLAEAAVMALGLNMDIDTTIPVLPGNKILARELLEVRYEEAGIEPNRLELGRNVKRIFRLAVLICKYPHHAELLCDMAPLDCFRPYK